MVLMPAVALVAPAFAAEDPRLADFQQPGSVIVFPKFISGPVTIPGEATTAASELEIGVVCPRNTICSEHQQLKIRFHWVCPGTQDFASKFVCRESDFDVTATVWEKIVLTPGANITGVTNKAVPFPPCERGYLIGWVIRATDDVPIKFDGLIGDAVLRESGAALASYSAIPIQAANTEAATLTPITTANGALVFDGVDNHYQAVTGRIFGDVRYTNVTTGPTFSTGFITLLTLDVVSNRPNNPVFVPLNFYGGNPSAIGNENVVSTFTEFICWTEQRIDVVNANLTTALMGRKGAFESGPAEKFAFGGVNDITGPVTLIGLVETIEGPAPNAAMREYITNTFNDSVPRPTCFIPGNSSRTPFGCAAGGP